MVSLKRTFLCIVRALETKSVRFTPKTQFRTLFAQNRNFFENLPFSNLKIFFTSVFSIRQIYPRTAQNCTSINEKSFLVGPHELRECTNRISCNPCKAVSHQNPQSGTFAARTNSYQLILGRGLYISTRNHLTSIGNFFIMPNGST